MRACVNSQTPFIKFNLNYNELLEKYGSLPRIINVNDLEEGVDFDYSPGGVTVMTYPLLKRRLEKRNLSSVNWVSLGVNYPHSVRVGEILASHLEFPKPFYVATLRSRKTCGPRPKGLPHLISSERTTKPTRASTG